MAQNIESYKGLKRLCAYWTRFAGTGDRWVALCTRADENHISDDMNRIEECMLGLDAGSGEIMARLAPCLIYGIGSTNVHYKTALPPYDGDFWERIVEDFWRSPHT